MRTKLMQLGTAAALAALLASPALAQTGTNGNRDTMHSTTSGNPAEQGHMGARDEVRASKLIGSTVYNEQNQSVGSLDDILMTHDQKQPVQAVISVGGFLGIGSKLVEVPYDRLKLEDGNKVVMPNASRDELKSMQSFSYNALDNRGTTNVSTSSDSSNNGNVNGARTGSTSYGTTTGSTATGAGMGTNSGAGTTTPSHDTNR
jgi:sporulation protein YlmC with PRC-barrel domain